MRSCCQWLARYHLTIQWYVRALSKQMPLSTLYITWYQEFHVRIFHIRFYICIYITFIYIYIYMNRCRQHILVLQRYMNKLCHGVFWMGNTRYRLWGKVFTLWSKLAVSQPGNRSHEPWPTQFGYENEISIDYKCI